MAVHRVSLVTDMPRHAKHRPGHDAPLTASNNPRGWDGLMLQHQHSAIQNLNIKDGKKEIEKILPDCSERAEWKKSHHNGTE